MKINLVRAAYEEYEPGDGAENVPHMIPRVAYKAFPADDGLKTGEYIAGVLDNFVDVKINVQVLDTDSKDAAMTMWQLADNVGGIYEGVVGAAGGFS